MNKKHLIVSFRKSAFYNIFAPISPKSVFDADTEKVFRAPLIDIALGKKDINTAFREAEEAVDKVISTAAK